MNNLSHRADASSAGCWIDGHWGQYGASRLIAIAAEHGWDDADAIARGERYAAGEFVEFIWEMAEDAEAFLNEHVAPEGYSFGWADGEFFLWSDEQWETGDDCDCIEPEHIGHDCGDVRPDIDTRRAANLDCPGTRHAQHVWNAAGGCDYCPASR